MFLSNCCLKVNVPNLLMVLCSSQLQPVDIASTNQINQLGIWFVYPFVWKRQAKAERGHPRKSIGYGKVSRSYQIKISKLGFVSVFANSRVQVHAEQILSHFATV